MNCSTPQLRRNEKNWGPVGIVDAHVHLWDTGVFALPWLTKVPVLAQRYNYADIASPLADGVICVQAGESLEEAHWLLEQAAASPAIVAVVLQYAPSDVPGAWAGAVHEAVEQSLAQGGPVAGVRIPARGAPDDLGALPGIDALCTGLAANNLVLELLLRPSQLASAACLAGRFPKLSVVLCHMGIGQDAIFDGWESQLERTARHGNVRAKLSGILSIDGDTNRPEAPARIVRAALAAFGADRLMVGSDWPMSIRTGLDYAGVLAMMEAEMSSCTEAELARVRGGTARDTYGIPDPAPMTTPPEVMKRLN